MLEAGGGGGGLKAGQRQMVGAHGLDATTQLSALPADAASRFLRSVRSGGQHHNRESQIDSNKHEEEFEEEEEEEEEGD